MQELTDTVWMAKYLVKVWVINRNQANIHHTARFQHNTYSIQTNMWNSNLNKNTSLSRLACVSSKKRLKKMNKNISYVIRIQYTFIYNTLHTQFVLWLTIYASMLTGKIKSHVILFQRSHFCFKFYSGNGDKKTHMNWEKL